MMPRIKVFHNLEGLAGDLAKDLLRTLQKTAQGTVSIALAGGSTPESIYKRWASPPVRDSGLWKKVHFFWGDERCVPPGHEESNYKMAYEAFLSRIAIPPSRIHRIRGEDRAPSEARRYEREIRRVVPAEGSGFPRFDWIFLGMGEDGHTASLFPRDPALQERKSLCVITAHPRTGQKRISLSLPVLNCAKRVSFLVTGKRKSAMVRQVLCRSPESINVPAALVQPWDGILEWYLDEPAAKEMNPNP